METFRDAIAIQKSAFHVIDADILNPLRDEVMVGLQKEKDGSVPTLARQAQFLKLQRLLEVSLCLAYLNIGLLV